LLINHKNGMVGGEVNEVRGGAGFGCEGYPSVGRVLEDLVCWVGRLSCNGCISRFGSSISYYPNRNVFA
jgi:hypothetical protein